MVDLLVVVVLSWNVWFGWQRGFLRTCMDALSLLLPMFVLTLSIPFLKSVLLEQGWNVALAKWMAGHLVKTSPQSSGFLNLVTATSVVQGLGPDASALVERFYDLFLLGMMGGAVFVGLQMILRVYETLWNHANGMWRSQTLGGALGFGIGLTISAYLISVMGLVCWLQGMEWLDEGLVNSIFVHSVYQLLF